MQKRKLPIMSHTPKPDLEKLRAERARNEAELRFRQNEAKALDREIPELERKARSHRIFTRGAMLEGFLQKPLLLTDEQVYSVLQKAFAPPEVGTYVRRLIEENAHETETGDGGGEPL